MNVTRVNPGQLFEFGPFTVRRQRPGAAFGPLSSIDMMTLKLDARMPMQQHKDEEFLTYVWRGSLHHQDASGERTPLSAKRALLVHAGDGVRFEQSVPLVEAEVLQVVIQPRVRGGQNQTQVLERPEGATQDAWMLLAGPENADAPMALHQDVWIYDALLASGQTLVLPEIAGCSAWLTVLDGVVTVDSQRLGKGDAISEPEQQTTVKAERDARLVCFLVKTQAA